MEEIKKEDLDELLNRRKLVPLAPDTILEMFKIHKREIINEVSFEGLPDDLIFTGVQYDWMCNQFLICICHPSFEPVAPSQEAPIVGVKLRIYGKDRTVEISHHNVRAEALIHARKKLSLSQDDPVTVTIQLKRKKGGTL